jgi:hypothetical protein
MPDRASATHNRWRAAGLLLILSLLLVAFGLRIHALDQQSLWNDEGSSVVQALRSVPAIVENAARDIHPPGYYLLLGGWRLLTGTSELALRYLSVLASVVTVALTYRMGAQLFGRPAGWIAAGVVALNTFALYYAQEARMYALLGLWSAAGMALLVQRSRLPTRPSAPLPFILALGLINAAGLYSHYAYPFVMLVQGVVVLLLVVSERRSGQLARPRTFSSLVTGDSLLLAFTLANLLALLLFAPLLPTAIRQVTGWPSTGQPIPFNEALGILTGWFSLGLTYDAADPILQRAAWVIAGLGVLGVLFSLGRRGARMPRLLPLLWVLIPVGLFLLLGLFRPANLKFLLPSQIGFALCMGAAWVVAASLTRIDRVAKAALLALIGLWLALLVPFSLPPLYSDPRYQRADYRAMAARISQDSRPGDAVILNAPNQEEVFRYYFQSATPIYPLPAGLGGDDAATEASVRALLNDSRRIFVLFWGEAERDPNRVVERVLDSDTFQAGEDRWYGDVRLAIYTTAQELGPAQTLDAVFGGVIRLETARVSAGRFRPGGANPRDVIQVELQWSATAALDTRYKVFLQLLRPDGTLAAQRDSEPVNGARPTTGWGVGEIIADRHGLALPPDLAAGSYTLILGLYDPNSGARLAVGTGDYRVLGRIEVE